MDFYPDDEPDEAIEPAEPPEDIIEKELDDEDSEEEEDQSLDLDDIDDEKDRFYNVNLVGRKVCGEYEGSGWCTGTIKYYNSKLDKYLLVFEDKSEHMIKENDINGVDMYFVEKSKRAKRVNYCALAQGKYDLD